MHSRREEAFKEGRGMQGGKRYQRREDAFKEGRGIQGGKFFKKRTTRQTYYALYHMICKQSSSAVYCLF